MSCVFIALSMHSMVKAYGLSIYLSTVVYHSSLPRFLPGPGPQNTNNVVSVEREDQRYGEMNET